MYNDLITTIKQRMPNPHPSYKIPKGTTPNPNGRPKADWTIKGMIQEALERVDKEGITDKQYVYQKLVDMAKRGDIAAQKEMNNRLEGMPTQNNHHEGTVELKGMLKIEIDAETKTIQVADDSST
jgi:hypothetical protein